MRLSDAIVHYKADRLAKGYAKGTVANEQSVLKAFLRDTGDIQVSEISARHLDAFWVRHTDWMPGTFNRAKAYLSSFFKWAQIRGYMSRSCDPLEGLKDRKVMPRDRIIIPVDEFDTVLEQAGNPRYRAMVALGLYLFVRVSEMRELKWQDLDFAAKTVRVHREKTQTVDVLPMCEELEAELKRWRFAYGELAGQVPKPGWYVVPAMSPPRFAGKGPDGKFIKIAEPMLLPTRRLKNLSRCIKRALAHSGYDADREGGHTLRRSGATALYNELAHRGHDKAMRTCQAMLGHSTISTTETYLRLDLDRKARNDLLAGKRMFPPRRGGDVVSLREAADGQADSGAL